jgi:hypothetical protein
MPEPRPPAATVRGRVIAELDIDGEIDDHEAMCLPARDREGVRRSRARHQLQFAHEPGASPPLSPRTRRVPEARAAHIRLRRRRASAAWLRRVARG